MFLKKAAVHLLTLQLLACVALAQSPKHKSSSAVEAAFAQARHNPLELHRFLQRMPKGADLHNHLSGAIYAEDYLRWAAKDGYCVNLKQDALVSAQASACPAGDASAATVESNDAERDQLIDAFSMRNFVPHASFSGHDQFFATFARFGAITVAREASMLAEARRQAARDHEQYLELMLTPDHGGATALGKRVPWDGNFAQMTAKLRAAGLNQVLTAAENDLKHSETGEAKILRCGTPRAKPACAVQVRYLYQVARGLPPSMVYAQILTGFELAQKDPRVVGLNLVMPEDGRLSMTDYTLHMRMLQYLHRLYPSVSIALHAGELAPGLVPPAGLRFHINQAVNIAGAKRIGHGVDIMYERHPYQLLHEMARRHIMVEICLSSNADILGISGPTHPFPIYRRYGVPVALGTDDEGVARSTMTNQFQRAVETYGLNYNALVKLARTSVEHAFLPGASLWRAPEDFHPVAACAHSVLGSSHPRAACADFLKGSPKAALEWRYETARRTFEEGFQTPPPGPTNH